jgi:hypothetical protein
MQDLNPYEGEVSRLYKNIGGGKFVDVSQKAGIQTATAYTGHIDKKLVDPRYKTTSAYKEKKKGSLLLSKGLGVVISDTDNDGWVDIIVANDTVPTHFYRNNGNGTFTEMGAKTGLALGESYAARGGMGIDAADIDQTGRESIVIGYYADQVMGLYHNQGQGFFIDKATPAGLAAAGTKFVVFGCVFPDVDNDGWPDIMTVNGHVLDDIERRRRDLTYAQRPLLFLNRAMQQGVGFREIGSKSGKAMSNPVVGRGLAYADYDLDGDVDVVITANGGPAHLLRNNGGNKNNVLRITLRGTKSNRDGIGAHVEIKAGKSTLSRTVRSGSSYLSQSELPLAVGIGDAKVIQQVVVRWPSGERTIVRNIPANRMITIDEAKGVLSTTPFPQL